jgi:hypothetical protein
VGHSSKINEWLSFYLRVGHSLQYEGGEKMKAIKKLLYTGGFLVVVVLIAALVTIASSKTDDKQDKAAVINDPNLLVYSAKYICGPIPVNAAGVPSGPLVPATYLTGINVHNPNNFPVVFLKKVAPALREGTILAKPSEIRKFELPPDFAVEIDCPDIGVLLNNTDIEAGKSFSKGFVVIETPLKQELDVVGVYTSMSTTQPGIQGDITLDVEPVTAKIIRR